MRDFSFYVLNSTAIYFIPNTLICHKMLQVARSPRAMLAEPELAVPKPTAPAPSWCSSLTYIVIFEYTKANIY